MTSGCNANPTLGYNATPTLGCNAKCFALSIEPRQMIPFFQFLSFWEPITLSSLKANCPSVCKTRVTTQKHKDDDMKSKKNKSNASNLQSKG
jgi:hypothetical protein